MDDVPRIMGMDVSFLKFVFLLWLVWFIGALRRGKSREEIVKSVKSFLIVIGAIAVAAGAAFTADYFISYRVDADWGNLEEIILDSYNRGYSVALLPTVKIHDAVEVGGTSYVLTEVGENLGRAVLVRGVTGRYKLEKLSYGGANFVKGIVQYGDELHLLYGGKNTGEKIAKVVIEIEGQHYELEVPEKSRFLVSTQIDGRTEYPAFSDEQITFLDADGNDITAQYRLYHSSF